MSAAQTTSASRRVSPGSIKSHLRYDVAGSTVVPMRQLADKLGSNAWCAWLFLANKRDRPLYPAQHGMVVATQDFIAQRATVSLGNGGPAKDPEQCVKRALRTLRRAGLVDRGVWLTQDGVRVGACDPRRHRYWRTVRGVVQAGTGSVRVPRETSKWLLSTLESARGHGGKRVGAGRPKTMKSPTYKQPAHTVEGSLCPKQSSDPKVYSSDPIPPEKPVIKRPDNKSTLLPSSLSQERDLKVMPGEAGTTVDFISESRSETTPSTSTPTEKPAADGLLSRTAVERRPRLSSAPPADDDGYEPPPRSLVARRGFTVDRPPPPKLNPADKPERHAALLASWYTGAIEKSTGKRCYAFKGGVHKSRYYKMILEAAQALLEEDVRPGAWVMFSLDVWDEHGDSKRPPPPQWVFSPKRIEEKIGWFGSRASGYETSSVVYTPSGAKLIRSRNARLSEDEREELEDRTVLEVRAAQAEMDHDVRTGKWCWA